ncbi:hypothetical protein GO988_01115 [Hymenobacter sp. HMF4947]|uniref:Uncharacterized protein n=1 Tax=Hymenobacter ginkgonis TaxID=2682976 RepID=A0A7K1T942_9BACT|nr:hypothetical protein [Hymenobacter ginkgonis]MVN74918.1 hypothetical protein [Hymenobacter ginkgonis]
MQFHQRQFTRSTQLALREHGFYISQRDGRGQVAMAVELPYEELLPLRLEYRNTVPRRQLLWGLGGLLYVGLHLTRPLLADSQPLSNEAWAGAFGVGVGLILFFLYGLHNWWHQAILHTSRLQVVLADHPRDRRQLRAFVSNLQSHTKAYLRREYSLVNPLGLIEPQLRRLAWLHELDVLSTPEAQALATRLTGRLPGRGIKSMGQRLEAPYVN